MRAVPRVLSIAGTDPTGGAGQHADLKTFAVLGGYGMSAVTAVVAQNTQGVRSIHALATEVLQDQLQAVSEDVTVDAVKIGMLGSAPAIAVVRAWLVANRPPVVVLDPVMVATAGGRLLDDDAEDALRELLHLADLVTPNLPELAVLLGEAVAETWQGALDQGRRLAQTHRVRVLVKGGHLAGAFTPDALVEPGQEAPTFEAQGQRVNTRNTHGTGCSLSSAIAVLMARTGDWGTAVAAGRQWLRGALEQADCLEVGHGNGPVHHGHHLAECVDHAVQQWSASHRSDGPTEDREQAGSAQKAAAAGSEEQGLGHEQTVGHEQEAPGPQDGQDRLRAWSELNQQSCFTGELWVEAQDVRHRIITGEFVSRMADGSLAREVFLDYLTQDLAYLQDYSIALSQLAVRAPTESWRALFATGAAGCAAETAGLHRTLVAAESRTAVTEVTQQYTQFLLATTQNRDWAVGVAAVLPCYWLYAWIAQLQKRRLELAPAQAAGQAHPYGAWIESYSDPQFAVATDQVRAVLDELARAVTPEVREQMRGAFHRACELEYRFFEDPWWRSTSS